MALVFVAGEARSTPGSTPVRSPWDGAFLGEAGVADGALADEALDAASAALPRTRRLPSHARRALLQHIAAGITARAEELARTIALEAAKPITLARVEVARAAMTFSLAAEELTRDAAEALPLDLLPSSAGAFGLSLRAPRGVVLAITPFNFPLNLVAHKLAPAFALGAPVVLKPAPQTPLSALALAAIVQRACDEAAVPRAILSVLPCPVDVAEAMARDPRPAVLSFTGSAAVGWRLKERGGRKQVLLELGGNAAAIVAPDADLAHAAARIVAGGYGYAGQVCIKVQRVYAHASVADALTAALRARVEALRVLDPMDPDCLCGPLIDEAAAARVDQWLAEAAAAGARVLCGGARERNRITPALVEGAGPGMKLHDEELFGPAVTLHRWERLDDCVAAVNAGRYGLQAGLFTRDLDVITRAFHGLDVGGLIVGDAPTFRVDAMPYGGVKDSGSGREGLRYAMAEMSEPRLLVLRNLLG